MKVLLSGLPRTGKTTLANRLGEVGYTVVKSPTSLLLHEHGAMRTRRAFSLACEEAIHYAHNDKVVFDRTVADVCAFCITIDRLEFGKSTNQIYHVTKVVLEPYAKSRVYVFNMPIEDNDLEDMDRRRLLDNADTYIDVLIDVYRNCGLRPIVLSNAKEVSVSDVENEDF